MLYPARAQFSDMSFLSLSWYLLTGASISVGTVITGVSQCFLLLNRNWRTQATKPVPEMVVGTAQVTSQVVKVYVNADMLCHHQKLKRAIICCLSAFTQHSGQVPIILQGRKQGSTKAADLPGVRFLFGHKACGLQLHPPSLQGGVVLHLDRHITGWHSSAAHGICMHTLKLLSTVTAVPITCCCCSAAAHQLLLSLGPGSHDVLHCFYKSTRIATKDLRMMQLSLPVKWR